MNTQNQFLPISTSDNSLYANESYSQASKQRWYAFISNAMCMKSSGNPVLHVKPTSTFSSFDIIERLLFAKTCAVIYTNEKFTLHQLERLQEMAMFSGTELVFIGDTDEFNHEQFRQLA